VDGVTPELLGLVEDLQDTLVDFRTRHGFGRGIAAPQIGASLRVIALHLGAVPLALINPRIVWRSEELFQVWDDCLSIPESIVRVERHRSISVAYQDELGRERLWRELPPDLSELLQHEIDHLDGVLMTERAVAGESVRSISEHASLVGDSRPNHRLSLDRIREAADEIDPVFLGSPQFDCEPLSEALGCHLTLKLETCNPIRSFKGRGAAFFVDRALSRGDLRPMVCASAGNFGQALAYACRSRGRNLVVYAAETANPKKIERMKALGAEVRLEGDDFDGAKAAARGYASEIDGWMVEDGLEPEISEGAGTIGVELVGRNELYDLVAIALGNGALLNGTARWLKAASPSTRVLGVSSVGADAMECSWRSGTLVERESVSTIADGIGVRVPIQEAIDDMYGLADDVALVEDSDILTAMRLLYRHAGLLIEPAGAVGVAAILADRERFEGRRVATILCGSHLTDAQVREWILES